MTYDPKRMEQAANQALTALLRYEAFSRNDNESQGILEVLGQTDTPVGDLTLARQEYYEAWRESVLSQLLIIKRSSGGQQIRPEVLAEVLASAVEHGTEQTMQFVDSEAMKDWLEDEIVSSQQIEREMRER